MIQISNFDEEQKIFVVSYKGILTEGMLVIIAVGMKGLQECFEIAQTFL